MGADDERTAVIELEQAGDSAKAEVAPTPEWRKPPAKRCWMPLGHLYRQGQAVTLSDTPLSLEILGWAPDEHPTLGSAPGAPTEHDELDIEHDKVVPPSDFDRLPQARG